MTKLSDSEYLALPTTMDVNDRWRWENDTLPRTNDKRKGISFSFAAQGWHCERNEHGVCSRVRRFKERDFCPPEPILLGDTMVSISSTPEDYEKKFQNLRKNLFLNSFDDFNRTFLHALVIELNKKQTRIKEAGCFDWILPSLKDNRLELLLEQALENGADPDLRANDREKSAYAIACPEVKKLIDDNRLSEEELGFFKSYIQKLDTSDYYDFKAIRNIPRMDGGNTILQYALKEHFYAVTNFILEQLASEPDNIAKDFLDSKNSKGQTALHILAEQDLSNETIGYFACIVEMGALYEIRDNNGKTVSSIVREIPELNSAILAALTPPTHNLNNPTTTRFTFASLFY